MQHTGCIGNSLLLYVFLLTLGAFCAYEKPLWQAVACLYSPGDMEMNVLNASHTLICHNINTNLLVCVRRRSASQLAVYGAARPQTSQNTHADPGPKQSWSHQLVLMLNNLFTWYLLNHMIKTISTVVFFHYTCRCSTNPPQWGANTSFPSSKMKNECGQGYWMSLNSDKIMIKICGKVRRLRLEKGYSVWTDQSTISNLNYILQVPKWYKTETTTEWRCSQKNWMLSWIVNAVNYSY